MQSDKIVNLIYWERQGEDQLCGVHCINTLLQGPFYDEVTLANIALELDQKEKQLMSELGNTEDLAKYMKQQSGNVGLDGNYSLQVLAQSLKRIKTGIEVIAISTIKTDLSLETAFICNIDGHWYSLRKMQGIWYNLNSTNRMMPEIVLDQKFKNFMIEARDQGFDLFAVRNLDLPPKKDDFKELNKNQYWIPHTKILERHEQRTLKKKDFDLNLYGADYKQIKKAIKKSMQQQVSSSEDQPEVAFKKNIIAAIKEALKKNQQIESNYQKFELLGHEMDKSIFFSIRSSIQQNFEKQPTDGLQVIFFYSNAKNFTRKFGPQQTFESLYDYVFLKTTQKYPDGLHKFYLQDESSGEKLLDVHHPIMLLLNEDSKIVVSIHIIQL